MKKTILILSIITSVFVNSCCEPSVANGNSRATSIMIGTIGHYVKSPEIYSVKYDGYEYIVIREYGGNGIAIIKHK